MKHFLITISLLLLSTLSACKISQMESSSRSLNRDLDLIKSPYQYKVSEDETKLLRVLRKMPLRETVADPILRADIEKSISAKLGAPAKISEIRVFETQTNFRREIWVADHNGQQLAFDIQLQATPGGGASFRMEGPVEIHGSL